MESPEGTPKQARERPSVPFFEYSDSNTNKISKLKKKFKRAEEREIYYKKEIKELKSELYSVRKELDKSERKNERLEDRLQNTRNSSSGISELIQVHTAIASQSLVSTPPQITRAPYERGRSRYEYSHHQILSREGNERHRFHGQYILHSQESSDEEFSTRRLVNRSSR